MIAEQSCSVKMPESGGSMGERLDGSSPSSRWGGRRRPSEKRLVGGRGQGIGGEGAVDQGCFDDLSSLAQEDRLDAGHGGRGEDDLRHGELQFVSRRVAELADQVDGDLGAVNIGDRKPELRRVSRYGVRRLAPPGLVLVPGGPAIAEACLGGSRQWEARRTATNWSPSTKYVSVRWPTGGVDTPVGAGVDRLRSRLGTEESDRRSAAQAALGHRMRRESLSGAVRAGGRSSVAPRQRDSEPRPRS